MKINLPEPPSPDLARLLVALAGIGSDRDQRIAHFALHQLGPVQRHVLMGALLETLHGKKIETLMGVHRAALSEEAAAARAAYLVILWRLGLILTAPRGVRVRSGQPINLSKVTFVCPACGNAVQLQVGETGFFNCPHCQFLLQVRVNDGRRVAFGRPKPAKTRPAKAAVSPLRAAYKLLGVPPRAPMEVIKKAHHTLVKQHHPDKCFNESGVQAATQYTAKLNAARDLIAQQRAARSTCGSTS